MPLGDACHIHSDVEMYVTMFFPNHPPSIPRQLNGKHAKTECEARMRKNFQSLHRTCSGHLTTSPCILMILRLAAGVLPSSRT